MFKNIVISDRARYIGIAVALAIAAGLLTLMYVSNYKKHVQQGESNVTVLVAVKDIPPGMPGEDVIKKRLVEPRELTQRSVAPGTFAKPADLRSLITVDRIYAGEQVTVARFKPEAQRGIRAELKGTLRAMQVPGDPNQLLAGTLRDGDHVDVVATLDYKVGGLTGSETDRSASRVVLRDLLVLRAPAGTGDGAKLGGPSASTYAQIALTDAQSQKLLYVLKKGEWSLALRPAVKSADSPESVEVVETVLGDGLSSRQFAALSGKVAR